MPESASNSASAASASDFELARTALHEITPPDTIGEPAGSIDEGDGVTSVYFATTMPGYPGWRWTVSIAHVDGVEPTVLETELTPGDDALLSPAWVPWADRLAEYKATQAELAADGELIDDDHDDDDDDDFDEDDINDDDDALLHSGDLDGVDIDSLEDDDDSDDDDDDDDDSDDDDLTVDESAASVGVEQSDESEPEPGDASPEPPAASRRQQRAEKQQEDS